MKRRLSIVGIVLFLSSLAMPVSRAQDGFAGAILVAGSAPPFPSSARVPFIAADFDNDQKPDGAILRETGILNGERAFRIELHLTAYDDNAITFSSDESGLSISAFDLDRDGATDIVVEKAFTHQRVQVYLNDGHGAFHKARAEDYPSSDPSLPFWGAQLNLDQPTLFFPVSGSLETGSLQRVSMLDRDSSKQLTFWTEVLILQSGARAPSAARAPPSLLSL